MLGLGTLLALLGWFAVRWVNGLVGRLKRIEEAAVPLRDIEHLDRAVTDLKAVVREGFRQAAQQHGELRKEVQDLTRYHTERVSTLVRELHTKVESTEVRLRDEIADVRRGRAKGGD